MFTWRKALKEAAFLIAQYIGLCVIVAFVLFAAFKVAELIGRPDYYGFSTVPEYHFHCFIGRDTFRRYYLPCLIA